MGKYSELLKDPRWQRKRLEIFNRDNWTCTFCESKTKQLQVHHIFYLLFMKPWEYPDELLTTSCVDCHEEISEFVLTHEFPDGYE
jgi:5-methylcytosine-specific restriction endonuclease McrA